MEEAAVSGITLAYEDAGSGEPVVFIHGALIADVYVPLRREESLAAHYRLVSYRRRGYAGSSPADPSLSVAGQAADCAALLRHLGAGRAHVVGHSFGGVVALQLALDSPSMVHSLALLEPALMIGGSAQGYRESLQRAMRHAKEVGPAQAVEEMMRARWPAYGERLEQAIPGAFDQAVHDASASFETELPALLDWQFDEKQARQVTQPVLSVMGEQSVTLSPRFAEVHEWLLSHMPDAEGYVLPAAHHFLQIENPGDMAGALASFLARHPMTQG